MLNIEIRTHVINLEHTNDIVIIDMFLYNKIKLLGTFFHYCIKQISYIRKCMACFGLGV